MIQLIETQEPVPPDFDCTTVNILEHNGNWPTFVFHYSHHVPPHVRKAVTQMLSCGENFMASSLHYCQTCNKYVTFPYTCHGRICSRCGKKYAEKFGEQLTDSYYPVDHRHLIFTIPDYLREILRICGEPWRLLGVMLDGAFETIEEMYRRIFPNAKVVPGMMAIVHVTGRAGNIQPHVHFILTEGGIEKGSNQWRRCPYLDFRVMARVWQVKLVKHFKVVLDETVGRDGDGYWRARDLLNKAEDNVIKWKDRHDRTKLDPRKGIMVMNVYYRDKETGKSTATIPARRMETLGSYLGRYLRHPPVGDSRLIWYDGTHVQIKYEWGGELHEATIGLSQFMSVMVWNIPPPGFKVARYRGMYAANKRKDYRRVMSDLRLYLRRMYGRVKSFLFGEERRGNRLLKKGQERLESGPFCIKCGGQMKFVCGHYVTIDGVIKYYGI